jgi:hypothetical protein
VPPVPQNLGEVQQPHTPSLSPPVEGHADGISNKLILDHPDRKLCSVIHAAPRRSRAMTQPCCPTEGVVLRLRPPFSGPPGSDRPAHLAHDQAHTPVIRRLLSGYLEADPSNPTPVAGEKFVLDCQ